MRPLVDKNQHQQENNLVPRRPQIVIGDPEKQLAPTCTKAAPSVGAAGSGANLPGTSGAGAYVNIAPGANIPSTSNAYVNFAPGANIPATSSGQETKQNSAKVIHCNFVLKRTNEPVHQI